MLRRMALVLAVVASLLIAALPAAAATTSHSQERGSGLSAGFSNVVWDEDGNLAPGDYFETYVDAATYVAKTDGSWMYQYVCIDHYEFTITRRGRWVDESWFYACGEATTLTLGKGLGSGHLLATFEAEECLAWDEATWECTEPISLGTIDVDLTLTGTGRVERWHGTGSGGTAGSYQYTSHGSGSSRSADVSGTVTLDGASLTTDATPAYGWLFTSKNGYVDVWHD
ncbi:MAG: hypothetical protein MUQ32_03945 [Chloroflexi bacterium]|nr:hypothetical protein [Chloroflexota bacterium]